METFISKDHLLYEANHMSHTEQSVDIDLKRIFTEDHMLVLKFEEKDGGDSLLLTRIKVDYNENNNK